MIQRNHEDLLKTLGATKVHSGKVAQAAIDKIGPDEAYKHGKWVLSTDYTTDTYVIRQKNKEVWVQVTPLGSDGNCAINVTERAAMPQYATIMKTDELKKTRNRRPGHALPQFRYRPGAYQSLIGAGHGRNRAAIAGQPGSAPGRGRLYRQRRYVRPQPNTVGGPGSGSSATHHQSGHYRCPPVSRQLRPDPLPGR